MSSVLGLSECDCGVEVRQQVCRLATRLYLYLRVPYHRRNELNGARLETSPPSYDLRRMACSAASFPEQYIAARRAVRILNVLDCHGKGRSDAAHVLLIMLLLTCHIDDKGVKAHWLGKELPTAVAGPLAHRASAHLRCAHALHPALQISDLETGRLIRCSISPNPLLPWHFAVCPPTPVDCAPRLIQLQTGCKACPDSKERPPGISIRRQEGSSTEVQTSEFPSCK
jgi:hypothetical protein